MAELAACLTLCAPTGMGAADRKEWLAVAFPRIAEIPEDLLIEGCRHAQETCDHPSKIIPAILGQVRHRWEGRRESRANILRERLAFAPPPEPESKPWIPEPGELDAIHREAARKLVQEAGERLRAGRR